MKHNDATDWRETAFDDRDHLVQGGQGRSGGELRMSGELIAAAAVVAVIAALVIAVAKAVLG